MSLYITPKSYYQKCCKFSAFIFLVLLHFQVNPDLKYPDPPGKMQGTELIQTAQICNYEYLLLTAENLPEFVI